MRQFAGNVLAGLAVTVLSSLATLANVDVAELAKRAGVLECGPDAEIREVVVPDPRTTDALAAVDERPLRL